MSDGILKTGDKTDINLGDVLEYIEAIGEDLVIARGVSRKIYRVNCMTGEY